jgi:Fe-S cluster assembly protein SufD
MKTFIQPTANPNPTDHYLAAFRDRESHLATIGGPAIQRLRQSAIAKFGELGFPTERNEDWKFTNLSNLAKTAFLIPPTDSAQVMESFHKNLHTEQDGVELMCVNNNAPFILKGSKPIPPGVIVCGLAEACRTHPELVEPHLGKYADWRTQSFVALNSAFWEDGIFIYVPPGVQVTETIRIFRVVSSFNQNGPYVWYRRSLIVMGANSKATVSEMFSGLPVQYKTNMVAEFVIGENAQLDHAKVQQESLESWHLACAQASLTRDSRFSTHYVGLGGLLVRNEARVVFTAENGTATVNGMYLGRNNQHHDNHTVIDHAKPHCNSHELYKGILDGKSKGVFNGKIFVRVDAQKTDAKQTNQTLLLSDEATIDTKPQLEIFADDVKCTHGATVGQLDEKQLFYLRSRGIGREQARAMLTFAFANAIVEKLPDVAQRQRLEEVLLQAAGLPILSADASDSEDH